MTFRPENQKWTESRGIYNLPIFDERKSAREFCHKISYLALYQKACETGEPTLSKIYRVKFREEISRERLLKEFPEYPSRDGKPHAPRYFLFKVQGIEPDFTRTLARLKAKKVPTLIYLRDFVPDGKAFEKIRKNLATETKLEKIFTAIKPENLYRQIDNDVGFVAETMQLTFWEKSVQTPCSEGNPVKHGGQIFTPDFLVKNILDYVGYHDENVLTRHIIDNSAGEGAFLCEIVTRYCNEFFNTYGNAVGLRNELERFIHGIEIDDETHEKCLRNLDKISQKFGLTNVHWNVLCGDALGISEFDGKMDFVVGNPPYVRVHNLKGSYDTVKSFRFAHDGMTDLYLAFFEVGFRMLNTHGKLGYITPSSWLSSLAATNLRGFISTRKNLVSLIDLGHFQAFEDATTYTMISIFDNARKDCTVDFYNYSEHRRDRIFVDKFSVEEMHIGNNFYVAPNNDLEILRKIKSTKTRSLAQVKNGFATLADNIFIGNLPFDSLTIPVLKASTGKWYRGFFPYDETGKPLSHEEIFSHADIAKYLIQNKKALLKNRTEEQAPNWFLFGRTQALKDVHREKFSINTIVRDASSIKLERVPAGCGVYSGLYILTPAPEESLAKILKSREFFVYLSALKNYKSGGYYTFSSKDLEQFLNYKLSQDERAKHFIPIDEQGLFKSTV